MHIQNLIAQGEHQQLDFKFEISSAKKISRTFSAFANTDGGTLLIGVKDNGAIAGVRSDEEKYMAESAAKLFCDPVVEYSTKEFVINDKVVLEITIPKGPNIPYFGTDEEGNKRVYFRVNDQNILANRILVNALKRKRAGQGTHIVYTDKEKILLAYLEQHPSITLDKFKELAGISRYRAETILTNLLAMDILEVDISEKLVVYRLSEIFNEL